MTASFISVKAKIATGKEFIQVYFNREERLELNSAGVKKKKELEGCSLLGWAFGEVLEGDFREKVNQWNVICELMGINRSYS